MKHLNEDFREVILPLLIVLCLYAILGFLGNIFVVYIYGFKYERSVMFRCHVLALSAVDMFSCCTSIPLEVSALYNWYSFSSEGLCASRRVFPLISAMSSVYVLFMISVYKFKKICKPFSKQLSFSCMWKLFGIGVIIAIVFAAPAPVLWGLNHYSVVYKGENITLTVCEYKKKFHGTAYPVLYRVVLSWYALMVAVMIILYCFVGRSIIKYMRKYHNIQVDKRFHEITESSDSILRSETSQIAVSTIAGISATANKGRINDAKENEANKNQTVKETVFTDIEITSEAGDNVEQTKSKHTTLDRKTQKPNNGKNCICRTKQRLHRRALIMAVLSGAFASTYIMAYICGFIFNTSYVNGPPSVHQTALKYTLYRIYFINYAINPVVYLILDGSFRSKLLKLFPCFQCKNWRLTYKRTR